MPLLLLLACSNDFKDLTAAPAADMTTVLDVRWARSDADRVWVEYGDDLSMVAPEVEGDADEHRVLVAGFPQLTDVRLRPVAEIDGERVEGEELTVSTGVLPAGLPSFTLVEELPDTYDEPFVMSCSVGQPGGAFILNRAGEIVWYRTIAEELIISDVHADPAGGVWINPADFNRETDIAELIHVGLDGTETPYVTTPYAHHAFERMGEGRFAWLGIDVRQNDDGEDVVGDRILRVGPDLEVEEMMSTWDIFTYVAHPNQDTPFWPQGLDWTHGNGLHHDVERGVLLYSSRNLGVVLELDAETGEVLRSFGEGMDYPVEPARNNFHFQHGPTWAADDTLLMFDSRLPGGNDGASRLLEMVVDDDMGVLKETWSWTLPDPRTVEALGDARRLPSGNTMSSWGTLGELVEVTPEGDIAWHVAGEVGVIVGPVYALESLYPAEE